MRRCCTRRLRHLTDHGLVISPMIRASIVSLLLTTDLTFEMLEALTSEELLLAGRVLPVPVSGAAGVGRDGED